VGRTEGHLVYSGSTSCSRSSRRDRPRANFFDARGVIVSDDSTTPCSRRYRTAMPRLPGTGRPLPAAGVQRRVRRAAPCEDARDVAQTVFMRVAERAGDYDPSTSSSAGSIALRSTSRSTCCAQRTRGSSTEDAEIPDGVAGPSAGSRTTSRARCWHRALEEDVRRRPHRDHAAPLLGAFLQEIAEVTGVDEKTVKSRALFETSRGSACGAAPELSDGPYRDAATDARRPHALRHRSRGAAALDGVLHRTAGACGVRSHAAPVRRALDAMPRVERRPGSPTA